MMRAEEPMRVDFVLTFADGVTDSSRAKRRKAFERSLTAEGLRLQRQPSSESSCGVAFLKISVPFGVMCTYAEALEFRKPFKYEWRGGEKRSILRRRVFNNAHYFKTEFRANLEQMFAIPEDKESFFTSAERAQVVWYILRRAEYDDGKVGIYALLSDQTYQDAYPLHDGDHKEGKTEEELGMRAKLKLIWANPSVWRKAQPLDDIREYFGDEVALYFAWLGLYTKALIPASLAGIACFLYGLIQLATSDKQPLEDVCYGEIGEEYMCRRCTGGWCGEEKLRSACGTRWLLLLFDHPVTVAYSIFMSFWATGFLELWKRKQARLCLKWGGEAILSAGGSDRDSWEPRPEYEAAARQRIDISTHSIRLYYPAWRKILRVFTAASVVFFMVAIVVAALIGVIVYKVAISSALYVTEDKYVRQNSKNLTTLTAAIINLGIIVFLKLVYDKIAFWLTDMENPKTQSDYETSYTFKVFVFEFFNCYSSLFYIAFFKGRFFTYPGDGAMVKSFLATDTCDSGGCLAELFIQLVVIMVGKQILNCFTEIVMPRINNWWTSRRYIMNGSQVGTSESPRRTTSRWEADYQLQAADSHSLFREIMEIVLQYGFVTLFVVAFPLAPLCALINNAAEIRVDADKLVTQYRRPLPRRTNTIGPWFTIQQTITYIAVAVNGFIIAFTTEFIPRLVYTRLVSESHDLTGYVNFTLSVYAKNASKSAGWLSGNITCRYKGFREPPNSPEPYALAPAHWKVLTAQLGFVILFEHLVLGLSGLLAYCIPDVPRSVREQAHREREKARDLRRPHRPASP